MSNRSSLKSLFTHAGRELRRFNTKRSIAAKAVPPASAGGSRLSKRLRALRRTRPVIVAFVVVTLLTTVFVWRHVLAANILWSSAGGSAWLTTTNWTGAAVPTGTDVAQFGANPTAATGVGINFNNPTNAGPQINGQKIEEVGAVEITSVRAAAMLIGDSSTTVGATGMFRLNGATVNSVAHTIIRNNSSQLFTIQNTQGTGTQTMSVLLNDATDNIINIDSTGGITISSIIKDAGGNHITVGGAGAGSLTLSGANTYTGGTTINSAKVTATANGALGAGNVTVNTTGVGLTLQGAFNNFISSTATVNIATGAMVALNQTGGSNTVTGLVLGGVTQTTPGTYGSSASGAANQFDSFFTGTGTLTLAGGTPTLNINDVTQAEGNSSTTNFVFTVSLTAPAGVGGVTFTVNTADGTATLADNDYVQIVNGSGSITQGNTSTTVTVQVNGDTTPEPNETFFVNISNIVGATAGDTQGQGTINNDDLIKIHDIQGSGNTSPLSGSVTTSGVVTGVRSNGFFIQEPDATVDADPNTSEGIFVFTSSAPPAAATVGNAVQVSGTLSEFIPSADPFSPPQTELTSPTVTLNSTGNSLPTPHTITAAETQVNDYNNLERFEGMRVTVPSMTAISGTQGTLTESSATSVSSGIFYGVVTSVPRPFREPGIELPDTVPTPYPSGSAPASVPRFDFNPERLRVNSKAFTGSTTLDVVSGQVITGITGPLDYGFRTYTIDTDPSPVPGVSGNSNAVPVPTPTPTEMTIASFNMERYFDTTDDPATSDVVLTATAFNNRLNKASLAIRNVLRTPDIVAVEEMEAGRPTSGEPDNLVLAQVATKVNNDAVANGDPNPNYQAYLMRGNDIGGINVGFLVKTPKITVFSVTQDGKSTTWNSPTEGASATLNDRPPLILRASIVQPDSSVLPFSVIVVHQRSLSGVDDTTTNTGAHVRLKRRTQAEYLANLIHEMQFGGARQVMPYDQQIVCLGDFNAFEFNDGYADVMGTVLGSPAPVNQVVEASSTIATNMFDLLPYASAGQNYSYSFDGDAQTLDHELVNRSMLARFSRIAYGRMDADYPESFRNDPNRPERLSDHDPSVAYFDLTLAPTATNGTVSGRITDNGGVPVAGAVVNLSGTQNRRTITDANGNYHFDNVETTGFYTVTPTRANFNFSPANRTFSQLGNKTEAAFTASSTGDTANPLDTGEYFVRQQYVDLLGREPDEGGFNYWSNQIDKCGADGDCTGTRRRDVAAAFFIEQEFRQTGLFIYDMYAGALGRKPAFAEYSSDRQQVVGGANLEAEKTTFAQSFVQRAEFVRKYQANTTADSFVDALIQNVQTSGVDLSSARASLINAYHGAGSTVESRASVMRAIADNATFKQAQYNPAFVLTEYFAYLRRDAEPAGYEFWLNVLNNSEPGNYRGMVCSFITSTEYQHRFSAVVSHSNNECGR